MEIIVNGEAKIVSDQCTVASLIKDLGIGEGRLAVEVNLEIVPRSLHAEHALQAGDKVEIVYAVGGGSV